MTAAAAATTTTTTTATATPTTTAKRVASIKWRFGVRAGGGSKIGHAHEARILAEIAWSAGCSRGRAGGFPMLTTTTTTTTTTTRAAKARPATRTPGTQ